MHITGGELDRRRKPASGKVGCICVDIIWAGTTGLRFAVIRLLRFGLALLFRLRIV